MATYRGAGAAGNGNNAASLSPGLPAGTAAGDLLVLAVQTFGGTNGRVPVKPADWEDGVELVNGTSRFAVWWKVAGTSEVAPTVQMTGTGAANDTQVSRIIGFQPDTNRAFRLRELGTGSTNASADNIGPIGGVTATAGDLSVLAAGKANDFNGNGALTNWTQAVLTESTTGNDAGLSLLYRLAMPAGATGSLTVTDDGATASAGVGCGAHLLFHEIVALQLGGAVTPTGVVAPTKRGLFRLVASSNIAAGGATATTAQLTSPGGTFVAGQIADDTPTLAASLGVNQFTEHEWAIEARSDAPSGETYEFRVVSDTGAPLTDASLPQWTVASGGGAFSRSIGGAVTPTGAVAASLSAVRLFAGAVVATGAVATLKAATRALVGAVTSTGALGRSVARGVAGTVAPTGALRRGVERGLAGAVTPAGALERLKAVLRSTAGAVAPAGALVRRADKALGGTVAPSGAVGRAVAAARALAGAVAPVGGLARLYAGARALAGAVVPSGALQATRGALERALAGAVTPTGAVMRQAGRSLAGGVVPLGALVRGMARSLAGAVTPTGAVVRVKAILVAVAGAVTPSGGFLRGTVGRALAGAVTPAGALIRSLARRLTGAVAPAGATARSAGRVRVVAGTIAPQGAVTALRLAVRDVAGVVAPVGALRRQLGKALAGAVAAVGALVRRIIGVDDRRLVVGRVRVEAAVTVASVATAPALVLERCTATPAIDVGTPTLFSEASDDA